MSIRTIDYQKYTTIETMDYDANNNLIYHGIAFVNAQKDEESWQIKKIVYDGSNNPTDILWADSNDIMDKIWNDRAAYQYG